MTGERRHAGVFAGLPRLAFRRWPARYLDLCAVALVLHGLAVAAFGAAMVALYVDLTKGELAAFAACLAAGYAVEGLVAGLQLRRQAGPARAWLNGRDTAPDTDRQAWSCAARLPASLLGRPSLFVLGALVATGAGLLLASLLGRPAQDALLVLPLTVLLYLSSIVLRYLGLELGMRPVLATIGARLDVLPLAGAHVSLHRRLVATVPTVTWAAGVIVGGLLTDDTRRLDTLGKGSLLALAVSAVVSTWLSLVLADAFSGPVVELRDATRRVAAGDLGVRVPVVTTDETGELAESFNAMVAGLGERERLREAFGAFVDPALTQRVLEEGSDLTGEERDVSVLFLDVRGFTAFAESAPAQDVVAALNALYDLIVPIVLRHGGHANRFLGDGLLAVFGAPEKHDDHASRAVEAGLEMTMVLRRGPDHLLRAGIGISTGRVVAGTIGGGGRRDFTVIGDAVNTAARVEAATRVTGDDLLITEATLQSLRADQRLAFVERPSAPLRGKSENVRLYAPRQPAEDS